MNARIPYMAGLLFLGITLISNTELIAQDLDNQLWVNYALKVPVNDRLSWGGDVGVRGAFTNLDWHQTLIRPAVNYQFKESASVSGALAWFGTFINESSSINELRFHQELNAKWPDLDVVHFFYRIRVEERFFFYQRDIPNEFRVRLRGLVGVRTQDLEWFGPKRPIYFESMFEGFKTIKDEEALEILINQARLYTALAIESPKTFDTSCIISTGVPPFSRGKA